MDTQGRKPLAAKDPRPSARTGELHSEASPQLPEDATEEPLAMGNRDGVAARSSGETGDHRARSSRTPVGNDLRSASREIDHMMAAVSRLLRHPLWPMRDWLLFSVLGFLGSRRKVLPRRMKKRFAKSASKRDPNRFRQVWEAEKHWLLHSDAHHPSQRALPEGVTGLSDEGLPLVAYSAVSEDFVPYEPQAKIDPAVKLIAFYLPQFHPFEQNDRWWGKGFTEWTNVGKAQPNFVGHYQPHCPIYFGYYDLRIPSVMEEQARIAREYGISGFSYYFYWFGGTVLMHEPLEAMLANPKVDIPFCLTWANENWTRRWDGQENEILIAQKHSEQDSLAFLDHVARFFRDPRYIRIGNKPVLIIYRAKIIPRMKATIDLWRSRARDLGFDDLYLIAAQTFGADDPTDFGFDAAVEFPPHGITTRALAHHKIVNPDFQGQIYDYSAAINEVIASPEPPYKLFRGAMLSWDNTARRQHAAHIYDRFSVTGYSQWLSNLCHRVAVNPKYDADEKLVFVNAWNEWAEGTHLEPDRKHGFGYLKATYGVAADFDKSSWEAPRIPSVKTNPDAVIAHVHYPDVWSEIKEVLRRLSETADLYISTTNRAMLPVIREDFPEACIELVENRGRDIRPFLSILRRIRSLNYRAICKIHSKKSIYLANGADLRQQLYASLLNPVNLARFDADSDLGLLVPEGFLTPHDAINMTFNQATTTAIAKELGLTFAWGAFPEGSMYWFRPEALTVLDQINLERGMPVERGLSDGTPAHAVERIMAVVVAAAGYRVDSC